MVMTERIRRFNRIKGLCLSNNFTGRERTLRLCPVFCLSICVLCVCVCVVHGTEESSDLSSPKNFLKSQIFVCTCALHKEDEKAFSVFFFYFYSQSRQCAGCRCCRRAMGRRYEYFGALHFFPSSSSSSSFCTDLAVIQKV